MVKKATKNPTFVEFNEKKLPKFLKSKMPLTAKL